MTPSPPPISPDVINGIERRRTIRIRKSSLLESKLQDLDRPSLKIAETLDEYEQAFKVLHDVYLASGYLKEPNPSGMHFGVHHLLPQTSVFIFRAHLTVLSTISYFVDTSLFGLPMDEVYKPELDKLRALGRKIVEIGSLATIPHRRGKNIIMYLAKAVFRYAMLSGADDMCIMVNPKHVRFYNSIFLFEPFGEERHYGKVGAPAVALHVDMHKIEPALHDAYGSEEFDVDLHAFFVKINAGDIGAGIGANLGANAAKQSVEKKSPLESEIARNLFAIRPDLLSEIPLDQARFLVNLYHKALFSGQLS